MTTRSAVDRRWAADLARKLASLDGRRPGPTIRAQFALVAELPDLNTFDVLEGLSVPIALALYANLLGVRDWPLGRDPVEICRDVFGLRCTDPMTALRDAFEALARG